MAGWKKQATVSGVVSARTLPNASSDIEKPRRTSYGVRIDKDKADICLACKKKECRGAAGCFKKRKKELACE